jgi:uncharacterized membrane protein YdfJ with MMPL/SSD domain
VGERLGSALGRIAAATAAHPWRTIGAWALAAAAGIALLPTLQARLDESGFLVDGSESAEVRSLVERELPAAGASVQVAIPPGEETAQVARGVARSLADAPGVREIELVSTGSSHAPALIGLVPSVGSNDASELVPEWRHRPDAAASPQEVYVGGTPGYYADVNDLTREDLAAAERIGLPLTFLVLIVAFGSLAAAAVPLAVGAVGLGAAFVLLLTLTELLSLQVFVLNLAVLVGFGVGVDYALLIVSRIRYELARGRSADRAIALAGEHAGKAIVVSGAVVVLSLAGIFAIGIDSFDGMAVGTMIAVATMVFAALTLLPAVAALSHRRLARRRRRGDDASGTTPSAGLIAAIVRRPLPVALASVALLFVVALPALNLEFSLPGTRILPPEAESRRAAELAAAANDRGAAPILIAVRDPASARGRMMAARLMATARSLESVRGTHSFREDPTLASSSGTIGLVEVHLAGAPEGQAAQDAVRRLRAIAGAAALVGGVPAERLDEIERYEDRLPLAVAGVLVATALMLLVAFRSVLLPVKAVLATLLSAAAALGAVTWVFQEGHLADLFGFQQIDGVPAFLPIFLFPIIFGLSMDYEVFLLSRISEERRRGASDREAIVLGVRRTARTITGAAAVMISVALAFAGTDLLPTQATGFGMSVAVLLDATIVRLALVPATLALLGAAAWWWPRRLVRVRREKPSAESERGA